jgi:dipeptidyl aminopeptidase/acylaminoacyl peptidase
VWLSSVIERTVLDDHRWHPSWNAAPMLVLHGANDERIPIDFVTRAVESLRVHGAEVEREVFASEDHYLVFTQRARVRAAIARWIARW